MTFIVFAFICASAVLSDLFRRNVTSRAANDRFDRFGLDPEQFAHFFRDVFEFSRRIVEDHELCFYLSYPLRSTYSATFSRFACAAHGKIYARLRILRAHAYFFFSRCKDDCITSFFSRQRPPHKFFQKKRTKTRKSRIFSVLLYS